MQVKINGMRKSKTEPRALTILLSTGLCLLVIAGQALVYAQSTGPAQQKQPSGASTATDSSPVANAQQSLYNASGQNGAQVTQDTYHGSIVAGKATDTVLDLSLDDAIQRGLRQNLGLILQTSAVKNSNGQRLEELQALLPTVNATTSIEVQQINLNAFGISFPGLNPIVGPFQVVDFRAYLTTNLVNVSALKNYIAAKHNFEGAKLTAEDARDLVVLTVGNAYLLCIADAARIEAVNAELATLARTIGLPLDQVFRLTDLVPFKALDNVDPQAAFVQALKSRKDLAAYAEQVKSTSAEKTAAWAYQLPVASFAGDYGDIGITPGHSHGTFSATGQVSVPVLQIAKTKGQEQVADAQYEQAKARLSDQIQQVNQDVRNSLLDIQSAAKLVDSTHSNVELANQALSDAQQRFRAGVADNLPVSQAQSQVEQANDQYISALYQHNVAKLSLARATGAAQTNYKDYLGGK